MAALSLWGNGFAACASLPWLGMEQRGYDKKRPKGHKRTRGYMVKTVFALCIKSIAAGTA